MMIHCDVCGVQLKLEDAMVEPLGDGTSAYLCSETCASEKGYQPIEQGPDSDERREADSAGA